MTAAPQLEVEQSVRADSVRAWSLVADPGLGMSWSPETARVTRSDPSRSGPLSVGEEFVGVNRRGLFRWSTRCRVVESDPGSAFAFDVSFLRMSVARWRYVFEPAGDSTVVREQWWDHRGATMKVLGLLGTGVADRRSHNRATMRATLESLRAHLDMPGGS